MLWSRPSLVADLPIIRVAMLGGRSFHDNSLVCKGNSKAIKQYVLITPRVTLCIHALGNFISLQFCNCPVVKLNVIGHCVKDGPFMCLTNCVAISIALATDHLFPPYNTTQGEQYLSRDAIVSHLWRWKWVKVVVIGRVFLISIVLALLNKVWP